ncbi:hypothetical protein HXX76_007077 [Chlamydomonas incerta]|uniref:Uncharacterized protein n=1 Tax=Chlamydomonas incerta TaxID=51695 RepID=A0A835W0B2_CHLIN|nr:hypothetical protein HXX76_007077 [Chlamydomonas incerta]|eukprot:KAG2435882.1 hypothetical protein HXX76_007077 [Chlamydomonas incerta]
MAAPETSPDMRAELDARSSIHAADNDQQDLALDAAVVEPEMDTAAASPKADSFEHSWFPSISELPGLSDLGFADGVGCAIADDGGQEVDSPPTTGSNLEVMRPYESQPISPASCDEDQTGEPIIAAAAIPITAASPAAAAAAVATDAAAAVSPTTEPPPSAAVQAKAPSVIYAVPEADGAIPYGLSHGPVIDVGVVSHAPAAATAATATTTTSGPSSSQQLPIVSLQMANMWLAIGSEPGLFARYQRRARLVAGKLQRGEFSAAEELSLETQKSLKRYLLRIQQKTQAAAAQLQPSCAVTASITAGAAALAGASQQQPAAPAMAAAEDTVVEPATKRRRVINAQAEVAQPLPAVPQAAVQQLRHQAPQSVQVPQQHQYLQPHHQALPPLPVEQALELLELQHHQAPFAPHLPVGCQRVRGSAQPPKTPGAACRVC